MGKVIFMKREFRGRSYSIQYNIPVMLISELIAKKRENQEAIFSDAELLFWKEMKLEQALENVSLDDDVKVVENIRKTILQQFNGDVSDLLLLHYLYLKKYIKYLKKQKNAGNDTENEFQNSVQVNIQKYGDKEWIEKFGNVLYRNCVFLHLINEETGSVDNIFLHRWMYYPVGNTFVEAIEDLKVEHNRDYLDLKSKEYEIFNALLQGELHVGEIRNVVIKKDGKEREVCVMKSSKDKLIVNYLAKRMRETFGVSFPDRDRIMEIVINLVDSLPKLQDYTIYRFDFKDFFKSVSARMVYEKFIRESDMSRFEKKLILELIEKTEDFGCAQGLATSNVLIEIVANVFDNAILTAFDDMGLVLYKRYVDDGIIIFNKRVGIKEVRDILQERIDIIFNAEKDEKLKKYIKRKVILSSDKERYQTKYAGENEFDYLGYAFCLERLADTPFYRYGIASRKLEKYKQQLKAIYEDYAISENARLLYHRLRFNNSRIVYYDYTGYKYKSKRKWDVRGLINSYRMLRRFMVYGGNRNKIIIETEEFLKHYHKELLKEMYITHRFVIPDFLKGKGIDNYSLWSAFEKNHSIVFQANIGWNIQYLVNAIRDITGNNCGGSYTDLVKKYSELIYLEK